MKKYFVMLVMFVCVAISKAQMVYDVNYGAMEFQVGNAWYSCADLPGGAHISRGDNVMNVVNNYFIRLRHDDPEQYVREYNSWTMRGGLAGVQPVRYSTAMVGGGMMGGGMMGGAMMVGTGMNNSGMVYGAGGMAGATSNVVIDNQNMMSTVGSGLQMNYDTGSNSLSVSGDPLMAAGRLINFIGGSGKKKNKKQVQQTNGGGIFAEGQILRDAQGNAYVVTDGHLVPVQQVRQSQSVQTRGQQVQQTTYNSGDFSSGW
jgi:hypothetical protein